jgi:hypothetical protein
MPRTKRKRSRKYGRKYGGVLTPRETMQISSRHTEILTDVIAKGANFTNACVPTAMYTIDNTLTPTHVYALIQAFPDGMTCGDIAHQGYQYIILRTVVEVVTYVKVHNINKFLIGYTDATQGAHINAGFVDPTGDCGMVTPSNLLKPLSNIQSSSEFTLLWK